MHSARPPRGRTEPVAPDITLASAHIFPSLDLLGAVSSHRRHEWFYRRYGHANGRELESAIASLEGAEDALACSNGMSAALVLFWTALRPGDHLVAAQDIYGGTYSFLKHHAGRLGIDVTFVAADVASFRRALRPRTRAFLFETISNPLIVRPAVRKLVALARSAGARVFVDNTFATPILARPLEDGVDAVYHSGTKFLSGHGDAMSGVIAGRRDIVSPARAFAISSGAVVSPFDAWLTLRGLRTLELRVLRASANAKRIAAFLSRHPKVRRVHYGGVGPMLSFETGGLAAAKRFVARASLVKLLPSLGDVATTVSHPARSSHAYLPKAERVRLGIRDELLRLSAGIENIDDIIDDLKQALR